MLAQSNNDNSQVVRGMNDEMPMPRNYSADSTGSTTAQSNTNAEGGIAPTGSKRKKPKLVLTIPNSTNSVSNASVATDLSSQGGQSILNGFEGMAGGRTTQNLLNSNHKQFNNMLNGRMPPPPPPPPMGPHHHHHGSISLLRTASAESSTGGMTPLSTALISPNHVGATPTTTTALHTHPNHHHVSYLIPPFSGMSLLSPIPLSPNVNGGLTTTTPSAAAAAHLTRMNSAESVGTVKIINDGELTRTDSLTSTTSFPPPLMRTSSQPMTPGANSYPYHQQQHHHARGWTTVETPRLASNGHFVPFQPLISPTTRTTAAGTPTAQQQQQQPRHFFASHHHAQQQQQQQQQQYQPSPHLGATTAATAAAYHQRFHHHHHHLPAAATAAPGSVPMHQPSYPNHQYHQYHHAQLASRATHPLFGATTATTPGGFQPSGWNVMSSMPMMTTAQQPMPQQQQQQSMPRNVHHLTQQVHHGLMNHHSHLQHHHHRGGGNVGASSDLYSMKDGSGMSSSVSVGSNSSRKTGDESRCDQFYKMKMQAKNEVGSMPVCRHWVKGTCWYGSTCKFRHPDDE